MIKRIKNPTAKIGIFAVGHKKYWEQFEGLRERLIEYHEYLCDLVKANDVEIVDFGLSDSVESSREAAKKFQDVDIVICNMATYSTSSVFLPIIQFVNCPVILVALQPLDTLDLSIATTRMQLENDNICSVPEFVGVAKKMGKEVYDAIIGHLYDDEVALGEISCWCNIAKVLHALHGANIGLMGHVLEAMYDMHTDPTAIAGAFGVHVPLLEPEQLVDCYNGVDENRCTEKINLIKEIFNMPRPGADAVTECLSEEDLYKSARAAVALESFVEKYKLSGLAYYYEGKDASLTRDVFSSLIVGNSILNSKGIPMCGEFDIKTVMAMLIMDNLGIGGSLAELHPFDFKNDYILVGHDGPHHLMIANGKPRLRSLKKYHGKPGNGASVEFKIKEGPITMLGITQNADGKFVFVIAEGISKSGDIPATGNTNTKCFFEPTTREFVKRWSMSGPTHHCALGIGHHAKTLSKIADVLGFEKIICS